ncbi:RPM1-INTERACTING PROTEIN 4 (RIN4) FAMILY PROTEIN [Salix koriyanagi]|uniref:RPM1-INTERACTING PROTEIN 4 (RIN4) FAMILY PROTEIN n=1 Tax=Salix koriyanagi TaxID=2511006 RepID=A0A9Q0YUU4_9ROSI|nr:RPM1-INTERACTING PROTEIN 4 (RIN4) FAMILY PROTEIN [Salix koriyanagi]
MEVSLTMVWHVFMDEKLAPCTRVLLSSWYNNLSFFCQQRSHVPKFGNWESEENVPYTAYFDKARKGRTGGKMINPNDPQENPDLVSDYAAPDQAPPFGARAPPEEAAGRGAVRQAHERRRSTEESDLKQSSQSPARYENLNRRTSYEPAPQRYGGRGPSSGEALKRPAKFSAGSDNSMEQSPNHQHARISGRNSGAPSPSWEGKNSYDGSHGTPGRSRLRPKGDESPDKGAAVPKFGDWDETNPSSADGYTHIFNKVREERQIGEGKMPGMPTDSSHAYVPKKTPSDSVKFCCFPWGRK